MDSAEILAIVLDAVDTRRSTDEAFDLLNPALDADAETTAMLMLGAARTLFTLATRDVADLRAGKEDALLAIMRAGGARGLEASGLL